jgi:hypothetical protein
MLLRLLSHSLHFVTHLRALIGLSMPYQKIVTSVSYFSHLEEIYLKNLKSLFPGYTTVAT